MNAVIQMSMKMRRANITRRGAAAAACAAAHSTAVLPDRRPLLVRTADAREQSRRTQ